MNHLLTCLFAITLIISTQAQNLLSNGNFENADGSVNCGGWYDDFGNSISFACLYNFWQVEFTNDTPPVTPSESWSILMRSDWPDYGIVKSYATGISGTYVYQLNYYMKGLNVSGGASIEVSSQNHIKYHTSNNSEWEQFSIIDTITTQYTDTITINLSTAPADLCDCGTYFDKVELKIVDTLNCIKQDIVFPIGSTSQGNYRTAAKINSRGIVTDHTKFMANNRVTLKTGFSTPTNEYFKANNEGCSFYGESWNEVNLDPDDYLKTYLPDIYSVNTSWGIDSWHFSAFRNDAQVYFNIVVSPVYPNTGFTDPFPASDYGYDQQQMIYATDGNGSINGVLYVKANNHPIRDQSAVYFHFDGSQYKIAVLVDYTLEDYPEVISILESVFY